LSQLPGTEAYRNAERQPKTMTFPGLMIWRISRDLFFASVGHIGARLRASFAAPMKWARPDLAAVERH
jgi:sulfate permease, SulP family